MCGRFTLFEADSILSREFGADISASPTPRYNIAPSQQVLAVRVSPGTEKREFAWLRWGLIPRWAKDPSIGNRMINARAETVAGKPAFRDAFKRRRCLIPASGFYEWMKGERRKQPHYIRLKNRRPFGIGGLWEQWQGPGDPPIESCTLLTTEANETISPLHDRMPVILPPESYDLWLNSEVMDRELLLPILRPFPADEMEAFPVGFRVNDPKVDNPRCIDPIDASH
ncbi:MAG: SOS response-associated peptidase [Deltaproteobacteria bacterium]|nr:SOS response-associated peptidase [Deltaproteobacteria bacterium]